MTLSTVSSRLAPFLVPYTSGMAERFVRTQIRIPTELHRLLMAETEKNGNSLNEEMVKRMQATFEETLQAVMVKNRMAELAVAERDILAEVVFVDSLVLGGADKDRILDAQHEAQARINVLEQRKAAIRADIQNLVGGDQKPIDVSKIKKPRKRS